jgi:phospholipase/carboxylesterase
MITNYYEHPPPVFGAKPKQIVMLLHGLGSDGRDLISLAPAFAEALPDALFISPDAPYPMGHQWFSLREWTPESMLVGVQASAPLLDAFIAEQLKKHKVPASKLALVGFSQGTMMSLYAAQRYHEPLAGVLGYSGAMIGDVVATHKKMPVHLIHGNADTVVPVMAYHHAKSALEKGGFIVTGHTTPWLMHGIDPQGIESGKTFLKAALGA